MKGKPALVVEFAFAIDELVNIREARITGRVRQACWNRGVVREYEVSFWHNGDRRAVWCAEDELDHAEA